MRNGHREVAEIIGQASAAFKLRGHPFGVQQTPQVVACRLHTFAHASSNYFAAQASASMMPSAPPPPADGPVHYPSIFQPAADAKYGYVQLMPIIEALPG